MWSEHVYDIIKRAKKYACYEPGFMGYWTLDDLHGEYAQNIDKTEYPDFETWLYDTVKMGIFVEIE